MAKYGFCGEKKLVMLYFSLNHYMAIFSRSENCDMRLILVEASFIWVLLCS